jgi:hypothetical protein
MPPRRAGSSAGRSSARASVALHSRATAVVKRLPWWDASTPVLRRFRHGSISCRLSGSAIVCRNGNTAIRVAADGFAVAR